LPQERLDEALGLPVGSTAVGPGRLTTHSVTLKDAPAQVAVGAAAIVGQPSPDRVPASAHGVERPVEEVGGAGLGFVRIWAHEGDPRMVIHRGDAGLVVAISSAAAQGTVATPPGGGARQRALPPPP